jgi:hypothetical protein
MTAVRDVALARVDWRGFDRLFFGLLLVSMVAHFGFVGSVLGRATGFSEEEDDPIDRVGRFNPVRLQPARPTAVERPGASPAVTAAAKPKSIAAPLSRNQLQSKVAHLGIIGALEAGQTPGFDALASGGPPTDLEEALRGASGASVANAGDVGRGDRRGSGSGQVARVDQELGTEGARKVGLGSSAHAQVRGSVAPEIVESGPTALNGDAVGRYVRSQSRAIQSCYEAQLKLFPTLTGKLAMRLTISPQGRVVDSEVDADTLRSDGLVSCVKSHLRFWKFPFELEEAAAAEVSWSFVPAS